MRISIIGVGKIGYAILKGIKSLNVEIIGTGRSEETLDKIKKEGIEATRDNEYAIKKSDIVILAVKPQHFYSILDKVSKASWDGKKVISVMAGIRISTLTRLTNAKVYRAMPNINAVIGKATTALAEERDEEVERIFKTIGNVYWIPEELFDVWTAIIGSGPAFVAEIIDAFALGAVACGMPRELAYQAILDMVEGTVYTLRKDKTHPVLLRDQVTTPAGTTIRGLMVMESEGIKSAIIKTIEAAYQRSMAIGKEIDKMY
ncbi:pyrroline-5-carboxylate reductase [Sulfolobus sp. S-194]|uniref:pyrroline-5-carboxylate reductase n=1 Tax=Sulfolobus sp. S-194 TaxID=2512240 RepID=UPI0014370EC0|nr:pyrroline-5-carboxylate reductase [Sulfolobus sp. S-194]QIW23510.1 pyrroline-5-carboxylate reductase [Sulfolobus sp. S-194]